MSKNILLKISQVQNIMYKNKCISCNKQKKVNSKTTYKKFKVSSRNFNLHVNYALLLTEYDIKTMVLRRFNYL